MFQAAMSPSAIGLPSPGVSAAAVPAPRAHASPKTERNKAKRSLRVDMLDLPFAVDAPAGDAVVMLVRESERSCDRLLGLATGRDELGARGLHVAGLVPSAALQDRG